MQIKSIINKGGVNIREIRNIIKCMATDDKIPNYLQQKLNAHYKLEKAVLDVNFMVELSDSEIMNAKVIEGKNILY